MTGSLMRGIGLCGIAMLGLASYAGPSLAGGNHGEPPPIDQQYSGPAFLRHIPGIRILFGDYALTEDQYNQLYGEKKKKKKIDETYYEPQPAQPKAKPVKPSTAPATGTAATANPALPQKTASAAGSRPAGSAPLTCEQATQVVAGFGFSSVEASSCSGKVFAFNARRGGKSFAIKLDPASGELTEVKKLP